MEFNLQQFNFAEMRGLLDDADADFNLTLIIGLATGLGVLFFVLLTLTIYFTFFASNGGIFLGSSFNIPGEFDDEQGRLNDEAEYLPKLKEHEREAYFAAKQFQEHFPPQANPLGASLSEAEAALIRDRGIQSYSFEQPSEHSSVPSVIVEDKLDVRFTSAEPNSAILNNPLPLTENDTVYFEVKLFELPEDSTVSIGVATKPYPLFRLPGYNRYSMAYESTGKVRVNQPFYTPEIWDTFVEGDVIGCGFKPRSGTVFFTRNGKKVVEAAHNVKFDMYPIVGSQGPSKLDVNLGQLGYVFIEANVKKWGFGSLYGTIGIPPAYGNELGNDTVLDRGEELPPNYPSEEETFFGPPALVEQQQQHEEDGQELEQGQGQGQEQAQHPVKQNQVHVLAHVEPIPENRPTKIISKPPSYTDEPKEELRASTPIEVTESSERLYERHSSTFDQENNAYDAGSSSLQNITSPAVVGDSDEVTDTTDKVDTPINEDPIAKESTTEPSVEASNESTPEPSQNKQTTSAKSNKSKAKKKKRSKKKGRK